MDSHQPRKSSSQHSSDKNSTGFKFLRQFLRSVTALGRWVWALCTQRSTSSKKRDSSHRDGVMKSERNAVGRADATTSSLAKVKQLWKQSNLSAPDSWNGTLYSKEEDAKVFAKYQKDHIVLELEHKGGKYYTTVRLQTEQLVQKELQETWSSRWVAEPIAALFPIGYREEWLGDLHEINWDLVCKGYPRWLINVVNLGRTMILIISALKIKVSDFFM